MTHQKMLSQEILWWMSLESYESAVDAQMTDAKEMEIETCTYKDCGYLFVDIQCHYWQFHPQFIKPNTNQANLINEKVTEKNFPEVQEAHKESNQSQDTNPVKVANHQPEKQGMSSDLTDDLPIKEEQKPPTETEICKTGSNSVWSAGVEQHGIPEPKEKKDDDIKSRDGGSNQPEDTEKTANRQPKKQDILSDHTEDLPIKKEQKPPTETEMCKPDSNSVWSAGTEHQDIPESKEEEDGDVKSRDGGSNQPEDTKPASHQPEDVLSGVLNGLSNEGEQPETVVSNPDTNAVWSAGNIKGMTDKKEEIVENLEEKDSFLSIGKSTFSDLKRRAGKDSTKKVAKSESHDKLNISKTEYRVAIHPSGKDLYFPFDAPAKDDALLIKEESVKPAPSSPSKVLDWRKYQDDVDEAQRRFSLVDSSEMKENTSSVTDTITVIKKRIDGDSQGNHINTYFNGKEISTMFDTGSQISTIEHNIATNTRIIEIEKKETIDQDYKDRIDPTESEKEECMEPASKIDTLSQEPNKEEIWELLPEFNGSSELSLLEAKDTWERILVKTDIYRDLWGAIVLSKVKGEALVSLQPSIKRDHIFEEICESLESIFGGITKTSYNIVKSHMTAGKIPDPLKNPHENSRTREL